MTNHNPPTIEQTITNYINGITNRAQNTGRTYGQALKKFSESLELNGIDPCSTPTAELKEDYVEYLFDATRELAGDTERLYVAVARDFYNYIAAEEIYPVNLAKVARKIRFRVRPEQKSLPDFPYESVERLVEYALSLINITDQDFRSRLIILRDRALIVTLADTGMRIHEACNLNRSSINFDTRKTLITGKGKKDAIIRFSARSMQTVVEYLRERTLHIDGKSGKPLGSLALFARHDKGAGKKILRMSPRTGQNVIEQRVIECLGKETVGMITPHTLRHYFVTRIVKTTDNLKVAQKLARHTNIAVTEMYAHLSDTELDKHFEEIFG